MSRDGFHVIDVHHHVGGVPSLMGDMADSADVVEPGASIRDGGEMAERLRIMDDNGVDQSVVMPTHEYLRPDGHRDTSALNDAIAAYRDERPDRFVAAIGIVEPLHGRQSVRELERIRDDLGLVGVSFHARFQGVSTDSHLMGTLVLAAIDLGLVPFVHCYADSPDEAPWKILDVAHAVPDAPIVLLDGFSGFERVKEISRAAAEAPNLVFDTSLVYSFDFIERFIDRFGPERVLFGTDMYSVPLAYRHSYTLDQLLDSRLDDETKSMVLADNVRRLLRLDDAVDDLRERCVVTIDIDLSGERALVTGSGAGIGREIARWLREPERRSWCTTCARPRPRRSWRRSSTPAAQPARSSAMHETTPSWTGSCTRRPAGSAA